MAIDLSLTDEEHVTLTGLNVRSGPGVAYKVLITLPAGAILWPQETIPSWVQGKLVTQEGNEASDWIKVGILKPVKGAEKTDQVIGYCWIGTQAVPTIASTKKNATTTADSQPRQQP
jgi:uncharacterized protein YraI